MERKGAQVRLPQEGASSHSGGPEQQVAGSSILLLEMLSVVWGELIFWCWRFHPGFVPNAKHVLYQRAAHIPSPAPRSETA